MRNMYKTLTSQYDPLGYIIPFTTRAKILIQDLWKQNLGWDELITPQPLKENWLTWLREIPNLAQLQFPRPYTSACADHPSAIRDLHIFCDASERAYGSVAYLRTTDNQGHAQVAFIMARSRVAPKKSLSMPRLELSAALTGAQLAKVIQTKLSIKICTVTLWSDSTTVLTWLASESCRYKVFVGTRVAEIQTLTDTAEWRYVDSAHNPADHITRGLTLTQLASPDQWSTGPDFLLQPSDQWPSTPVIEVEPHSSELRKNAFIGTVTLRRQYWILRGREAVNISANVKVVSSGVPSLKSPKWLIFHPAGCNFTNLHSIPLEWIVSAPFQSKLVVAMKGDGHDVVSPWNCSATTVTNFVGGDRELRNTFGDMSPELQELLAPQKLRFQHIPPNAPHFGGTWEREVKFVKIALRVILREQVMPEPVLQTLLVAVEGILNAKPLGYVSYVADLDPVTPNLLLMGRRDASLPQVLFDSANLIGRRRW
ncbi:uncharacterized protein LOC113069085, partial [Tachysurus ichikawai]